MKIEFTERRVKHQKDPEYIVLIVHFESTDRNFWIRYWQIVNTYRKLRKKQDKITWKQFQQALTEPVASWVPTNKQIYVITEALALISPEFEEQLKQLTKNLRRKTWRRQRLNVLQKCEI